MSEAGPETQGRLPGVAYPLIALVLGGILVWSFSRILLAVGKDEAVAIATLMALNILVGAALVAYGRRVRGRPVAFPFIVAAGAIVVVAGAVSAFAFGDKGPEKAEAAGPKPQAVSLTSQGTKFVETKLNLTAGARVSMKFDNKDAGVQHNFALFDGPDATAPVVFRGDLVPGPATVTYSFTAPPKPGTYFFHCDVHPTVMKGTVTVAAGAPPPGGAAGAPLQLSAKNIAFSPTKLTAMAGGKITIHFNNQDPATPHNVVVFNGPDATAPVLFKGDLVTGPASADYTFDAPPPGTYFFHCEVHPQQMTGTLTITR